jgi:uncharacterized membrane protein
MNGNDTPDSNVRNDSSQDRQTDLAISNILRTGVIVSTIVAFAGVLIFVIHNSNANRPSFAHFHGLPDTLTTLQGILNQSFHGNPEAIMQSGVVLLLFTPIIRVAFSALVFLKQRDWFYLWTSVIVLCVLLFSLLGAPSGGI